MLMKVGGGEEGILDMALLNTAVEMVIYSKIILII
jgi:hypothetical protein